MPLSQTGGHGDFRKRTQSSLSCACCSGLNWAARVADGVPEVIKAARDELRKGADHIKLMVSGGVASQSDPLESVQYRTDEIEAAVEEADRWGSYVCAHAYSARAISRAVKAGVRTIEHGNLIDSADRRADGGERRVYRADAGRLRCAEAARAGLRPFRIQHGEERMVLDAGLRSLELTATRGSKSVSAAICWGNCRTTTATNSPSAARSCGRRK